MYNHSSVLFVAYGRDCSALITMSVNAARAWSPHHKRYALFTNGASAKWESQLAGHSRGLGDCVARRLGRPTLRACSRVLPQARLLHAVVARRNGDRVAPRFSAHFGQLPSSRLPICGQLNNAKLMQGGLRPTARPSLRSRRNSKRLSSSEDLLLGPGGRPPRRALTTCRRPRYQSAV
jgi:hypothetical protein